jgi:hypothetical protein
MTQRLRTKKSGAVVYFDFKGDHAAFETARLEAERAGRTFKFFTNELGKATFTYNPWRGKDRADVSVRQIAETFLNALDLQHGPGYGRSYYTREARDWLRETIARYPIRSFADLRALAEEVKGSERDNIGELVSVVKSLGTIPHLNFTDRRKNPSVYDNAIVMSEVVAREEVAYFWLPTAKEQASAGEIGKLAFYDLYEAVEPKKPVTVIIDEFQTVVSRNIEELLFKSRSKGMTLWLANQTLSSLRNDDIDIRDAVWGNTHFKLVFSVPDPHTREYIEAAIGFETLLTKPEGHRIPVPLFGPGGFRELNSDHSLAVAHVLEDSGRTNWGGYPVLARLDYSMSAEEYHKRSHAPWPKASAWPGSIVFTESPAHTPVDDEPPAPEAPRPERAAAAASNAAAAPPDLSARAPVQERLRSLKARTDAAAASVRRPSAGDKE